MRPLISACLLAVCAAALAPAATLSEARTRWLKGNYEEAEAGYQALLKDPKAFGPASIGLTRALESQGKYDKALTVIEDAVKKLPKDADVLARQAEMLHFRGRWDDADKAVAAALEQQPNHVLARWVKAQLFRDRGDVDKANTEVKAIVRHYSNALETPQEIKAPEALVIVGLASAENARWNNISDEFQVILQDLYGDALKNDKNFWVAEHQAGLLLLEKYNRGEALDAFDKALTINPSAAEALVARGVAALMRFEMKDAEDFATRALKINPSLPEALRLRADVHLATGDLKSAAAALEQARKVSPRDERVLARLAAVHTLNRDDAALKKVVAEVEGFDKRPAPFYFDLGERLEERKRYALAEKYYQQAAKLRPNMPGPNNHLGLLYMRLGDEAKAAPLLDAGFKADPFNVRVSNTRKVLAHLKGYKEIKTKHFRLRYDPETDPVLGPYLAEYLEATYEELARKFNYRPAGPFLVELFRTHEMFSGRVISLPDLHTIGACTGRVFAMVSPNGRGPGGGRQRAFNWARVLRHELVHLFNLDQTDFLVPHWFTEGLAVSHEGFPRRPDWNKLLADRAAAGRLLTLDTIDLAFIRPRDALEWTQAYCQAQLYVEYIESAHKPEAIGKLLALFAKGHGVDAALKEACGVDRATFEKGYKAYVNRLVGKLRGKTSPLASKTLAQLRDDNKKDPKDADVAAELATRLVETARRAEARKLAEGALEKRPTHPKALYVLAALARRAADSKQEKSLLEKALDRDNPEPLVLKALGKIYYDAGELSKAADLFELGRKQDRFDREWLVELARTYAQLDSKAKLISVLKDLVPTDADDFDRRLRLARLLLESKDAPGAEKYAREALEINVTSKDAQAVLFQALEAQGDARKAELKRLRGLLTAAPAAKGK